MANVKEIGVNIHGVEATLTDVEVDENWYCRYVQCGVEDEKGKFTGIISDYEGGGISDISYFANGEEIMGEMDEDESDEFEEKAGKELARQISGFFDKFFVDHPTHTGYLVLKKEKRASFLTDFQTEPGANIYKLQGHKNLDPIEKSRGMSMFQ